MGPGVVANVAERGGSKGRVGVGGGTSNCASSASAATECVCGDSTVMTGFPLDAETVRRCSCFGVLGNWGDFGGGPSDCGRPGASNLGFGFSCGLAGN